MSGWSDGDLGDAKLIAARLQQLAAERGDRIASPPEGYEFPPCPDCGAAPDQERHVRHADRCPLGRALDEAVAQDREFFEAHPGATEYWRPVTHAEVLEHQHSGALPVGTQVRLTGRVHVIQVAPGFRLRDFSQVDMWVKR